MPSGYEQFDDYGGPPPGWPTWILGACWVALIAFAGWWFFAR